MSEINPGTWLRASGHALSGHRVMPLDGIGRARHRLGLTSPQYSPSMAKSWSGNTSMGA